MRNYPERYMDIYSQEELDNDDNTLLNEDEDDEEDEKEDEEDNKEDDNKGKDKELYYEKKLVKLY